MLGAAWGYPPRYTDRGVNRPHRFGEDECSR